MNNQQPLQTTELESISHLHSPTVGENEQIEASETSTSSARRSTHVRQPTRKVQENGLAETPHQEPPRDDRRHSTDLQTPLPHTTVPTGVRLGHWSADTEGPFSNLVIPLLVIPNLRCTTQLAVVPTPISLTPSNLGVKTETGFIRPRKPDLEECEVEETKGQHRELEEVLLRVDILARVSPRLIYEC